jgi:hypothetical protein
MTFFSIVIRKVEWSEIKGCNWMSSFLEKPLALTSPRRNKRTSGHANGFVHLNPIHINPFYELIVNLLNGSAKTGAGWVV